MEKRISYSQFQSVKCVAKACDPLISKRAKLKAKIDALTKEFDDCNTQISSLEAGIVSVIGLPVEQLVKKVIEPGIDINGQPKKTTKYLPTDIVSYDEQHKQYVITINSEEPTLATAEPEEVETCASMEEALGTPQTESVAEEEPVTSFEEELSKSEATTEDTVPTDAPVFE